MTFATFFLSSGRCGTQWIAKNLGDIYGDLAVVEHEPLYTDYLPRLLFAHRDPKQSDNAQRIVEHAVRIERDLESKHYVECGWLCYGAIPYFLDRFEGRVRIVHFTRHPVPTAYSLVTHQCYGRPRADQLTEKALLTPFDKGTSLSEYRMRWEELNQFERCLYFWAEIQNLGFRIEATTPAPFLRLRSEDLFGGSGLQWLLDFLGLPRREPMFAARSQRYDQFSFKTQLPVDTSRICAHPKIMKIAERLGYNPLDVDGRELERRYRR